MRIVRYRKDGRQRYGIVEGANVYAASGNPFTGLKKGRLAGRLERLTLLPPVKPTKIAALGRNYLEHAKEMGSDLPPEPLVFLKAPTAVIGPGEEIVIPTGAGRIDYEGELVAVIGKRCRNVPEEQAFDVILGYTCGNDVTAREQQSKDGQWARAKSYDSFAPIGPVIVTGLRPEGRRLMTRLNGRIVQEAPTDRMMFKVSRQVAHISRFMTLLPGDLIFTGTPSGIGPMRPGDVVEVEIEGIGLLRNICIAEPAR